MFRATGPAYTICPNSFEMSVRRHATLIQFSSSFCIWFGLYRVSFSFFDHHTQSSVHCKCYRRMFGLYFIVFIYFLRSLHSKFKFLYAKFRSATPWAVQVEATSRSHYFQLKRRGPFRSRPLLGPTTFSSVLRMYMVWTLLGIFFFLRSLYSKFFACWHQFQSGGVFNQLVRETARLVSLDE